MEDFNRVSIDLNDYELKQEEAGDVDVYELRDEFLADPDKQVDIMNMMFVSDDFKNILCQAMESKKTQDERSLARLTMRIIDCAEELALKLAEES